MNPADALKTFLREFNTEIIEPQQRRENIFRHLPEAGSSIEPREFPEKFRGKIISTDIAESFDEMNTNLHFLIQPENEGLITSPIARTSKNLFWDVSKILDYIVCHAMALGQNTEKNYLQMHPHILGQVREQHSDPGYFMNEYPQLGMGIVTEFLDFPQTETKETFEGLKLGKYQ